MEWRIILDDGFRSLTKATAYAKPGGWEIVLDLELMRSVAEEMMSGNAVSVGGKSVLVRRTSSQRLRTVKFEMNGRQIHAIEQNPEKPSRWGQLAREGHRVVQFRDEQTGKYVAVAVDGAVREYGR